MNPGLMNSQSEPSRSCNRLPLMAAFCCGARSTAKLDLSPIATGAFDRLFPKSLTHQKAVLGHMAGRGLMQYKV